MLDAWLPDPAIRTYHRRTAPLGPAEFWQVAQDVQLRETGRLDSLVRWRIPGTPPETRVGDLFRSYPVIVLDEGDTHLVSGLVGRIWTLTRDYPRLDGPDAFRAWSQRGTVRVAFAHWVTPHADGAEIHAEARVQTFDRVGSLRLKTLWAVLGRFERLIGASGLSAAVRRAEPSHD